MMIVEIGDGVDYVQQGSLGEPPKLVKTPCPHPFLEGAVNDQGVKEWWKGKRHIFEALNPYELAQRFHDRGAKAEVSIGRCLTLGIAGAPPVTVSFSRAAMVYGFLLLG